MDGDESNKTEARGAREAHSISSRRHDTTGHTHSIISTERQMKKENISSGDGRRYGHMEIPDTTFGNMQMFAIQNIWRPD